MTNSLLKSPTGKLPERATKKSLPAEPRTAPVLQLVGAVAFCAFVLALFKIPIANDVISRIDLACTYFFNAAIGSNVALDKVLGYASTKYGDICLLFFLITVFGIHSLYKTSLEEASKKLTFWGWVGLWSVVSYLLVNVISDDFIPRQTPLSLLHIHNVEQLYNLTLRTSAAHSFPSGHCFAYMMFASASYNRYPRVFWLMTAAGVATMVVRLSLGLHWFSDIALGSVAFTFMVMSMAFLPISMKGYRLVEKLVHYTVVKLAHQGFPILAQKQES